MSQEWANSLCALQPQHSPAGPRGPRRTTDRLRKWRRRRQHLAQNFAKFTRVDVNERCSGCVPQLPVRHNTHSRMDTLALHGNISVRYLNICYAVTLSCFA